MIDESGTDQQTRKVDVLLLVTGLGIGGAEMVVRDLAHAIDPGRFNVSIICCLEWLGPIGSELAAEGIDISVLPKSDPGRSDYFTSFKLRRLIRGKRIDVVHSHTTHALADAALCRCVTPGLKAVHTFHFGNYPHTQKRILWMERISSRMVDRLIAVGQVQKEQIKASHCLRDSAITVVRNGVLPPKSGSADASFRTRVGGDGKILVGTITTLIPQKGLQDLLQVARRVRDVRADLKVVVVGDGVLRAELERMRRELGLEETVTFTGWLTNASSIALPSFDIYFQPSLWEALSISILEAMAAGKPVVSTLVGEAPHLIENGSEGFLFKARDIEGMAQAILRLSRDEGLRHSVGDAAARKVAQRFTVAHMARAYEQVYLDVLRTDSALVTRAAR